VSVCSSIVRWLLALVLLVVSIVVTSGLIAFSMLYIASTSNCQTVILPSTSLSITAQIAAVQLMGSNAQFCYCN